MLMIGADPEFFVQGPDGLPLPIVGLLGGDKENPIPVEGWSGYAVQEDNVMAEYNIPPTNDPDAFADSIVRGQAFVLERVRRTVRHATIYPGCSVLFPEIQLANAQAQLFGCSPDFDAYHMGAPLPRINPTALIQPDGSAWRFAGGHVHLGYRADITYEVPEFVVATLADLFIGLPMVAHGLDNQGERRKWYGTPGRYRPTKYGVEYRTLSNSWTLSRRHAVWVGSAALRLMSFIMRGEEGVRRVYNDMPWADIQRAIATADQNLAGELRAYARGRRLEVI